MIPLSYVPYELIGFVVFWSVLVVSTVTALGYVRLQLIAYLDGVRQKLWEGKSPSKGERPEGRKLVYAFYLHLFIKILKFDKPITWRWKTYKKEYGSE